ncbi:MAG: hypothetical protein FWF83_07855, partial [Clostridiales bacterium]|nr:hypothetical protein [Clostridiales bacterium]
MGDRASGSAGMRAGVMHRGGWRIAALMAGMMLLTLILAATMPAFGAIVTVENSLLPVLTVEVTRQDP